MADEIRVVELFAGVGGFRLGLERASDRFRTVWADQWEPGRRNQFAFDCYQAHFGDTGSVNVNEDISQVWGEVPEHDLLVGGFPCQDYSVAATQAKGIEGRKGVLWWSIYDIIRLRRPSYVLLENVDRLVRSPAKQRGRDFGIILRCLADEGYRVEWRVINAADYGLQQRRRRTFIFACRGDVPFASTYDGDPSEVLGSAGFFAPAFPVTIPEGARMRTASLSTDLLPTLVDVSDRFAADFCRAGMMSDHVVRTCDVEPVPSGSTITLRGLLQRDVDERYFVDNTSRWEYMKGSKRELRTRGDGSMYHYSEGAIPYPDILDRPGRTMLTSEGTVNRSSHIIEDPQSGRLRVLTPVECERLNGFPDGWTDTGMTDRQRYFTMGNALVVQLIERMGRRISDISSGTETTRTTNNRPTTLDSFLRCAQHMTVVQGGPIP